MNLSITELRQLPLAAALVDREGQVIAQTPEWRGATPGTATYRVRANRLLVATGAAGGAREALLQRLLDELDTAVAVAAGIRSLQLRILSESLRLVAGQLRDAAGNSDHVVHLACAGIRARTSLDVTIDDHPAWPVANPESAALVLVQFAVNAERHAGARSVAIRQSRDAFHVWWRGRCRDVDVTTSRRREARTGWGLGFARLAADALGGSVYPPYAAADGGCASTLELGLRRLALPLAAVRRGAVLKATRAWDEETGLLPGTSTQASPALERACVRAGEQPHRARRVDGWHVRAVDSTVWIAIPRAELADRARDVVDGIAHERALWDGAGEPVRSRVTALAALLGAQLGAPLQRAPALAWTRRMRELAAAFGLPMSIPECPAPSALDPQVTALLAHELGERFEAAGDALWLRLRPGGGADPLVCSLPARDGDSVVISGRTSEPAAAAA